MNSKTLAKMRILVATSDNIIRNFLKIALQSSGYQILLARDGIEALYMINTLNMTESPFDLYLIDTSLKKMGYVKLIDRIKQINTIKPIILLINEPSVQTKSMNPKYPLIGMIKKPFLKEELFNQIEGFLR